jgi:hypothetical protein
MVSKVLAFATALTLFLPARLSQWRTTQQSGSGTEQASVPAHLDPELASPPPPRVPAR